MAVKQTISQERARFALDAVNRVKAEGLDQKKCRTVANAIPAYIQRNGIGQAVAFALSKDKKEEGWKWAEKTLDCWLRERQRLIGGKSLIEGITSGSMDDYKIAQAEAMALLVWIRKFARALLAAE